MESEPRSRARRMGCAYVPLEGALAQRCAAPYTRGMNWRQTLRFGDNEDLTFSEVHDRFREMMSGSELSPAELMEVSKALELARAELGTTKLTPTDRSG